MRDRLPLSPRALASLPVSPGISEAVLKAHAEQVERLDATPPQGLDCDLHFNAEGGFWEAVLSKDHTAALRSLGVSIRCKITF